MVREEAGEVGVRWRDEIKLLWAITGVEVDGPVKDIVVLLLESSFKGLRRYVIAFCR